MAHRITSFQMDDGCSVNHSQFVPINPVKKCNYAVERLNDSNDAIKSRFDGASWPFFQNHTQSKDSIPNATQQSARANGETPRQSSSCSSSPVSYRKRERAYTASPSRAFMNTKKSRRSSEKVPYFVDESREKDRLIYKYGITTCDGQCDRQCRRSPSSSPRRSYSRSLSRTPTRDSFTSHSKSNIKMRSRYSRSMSRNSSRHSSRARPRSPHNKPRHRRRSRSRSRTRNDRSRSRERRSAHSTKYRSSITDHTNIARPPTQIITIPVPFDPYRFPAGYPTWHPMPVWSPGPPLRFTAPYSYPPVMSPFANTAFFPPYRPPPTFGMPLFRQRFATRLTKTNFRPRTY